MAAGGQVGGGGQAVVDAQVVEVLEVVHIGAGDGGGALGPGVVLLLIEVLQVGHMAGEAPGGGVVHVAGGESVEAQGGGVGVDVLHHSLQGGEVLDLVHGVAGLLHQVGVDDDAVALVAVADGHQLAGLVIEVVGVGVQLVGDGGAGQVHGVVAPVSHAGGVADDEQGGRRVFIHLGGEGLLIGAGGGGDHLDGHTGLVGVGLGQVLGGLVQLGLEVQPVDPAGLAAGSSAAADISAGGSAAAAGQQGQGHGRAQGQGQDCFPFFHFVILLK